MRIGRKTSYKFNLQGSITNVVLPMLVFVQMTLFSACQSDGSVSDGGQKTMAFHVSTTRATTRMSDAVTQIGQTYRGIQDVWLFPFHNDDGTSLSGNVVARPEDIQPAGSTVLNYFNDNFPEIPTNTNKFLCYARAVPVPESGKSVNGSLTPSITDASKVVSKSAITFTPVALDESDVTFAVLGSSDPKDPTDEVNKNRKDRFIYPPELYYYAFSYIKSSSSSQKDYYTLAWSDVLAKYETDYATTNGSEASIAIKDPLHYAVGCLQIGLVANALLEDADGAEIKLSAGTPAAGETPATLGTFPLTGVFVTGQHQQAYDFTPVSNSAEKIIYDKAISGVTMGDSKVSTPATFSNTLVLQTNDGEGIRFALEFTNNSGVAFKGANGEVPIDAKFYLVGSIQVTTGHAGTEAYKNRVFTKDYITQGVVKIESLKQAYTYLPDLLDPRLEVTLKLEPDWIQSTTTNVPL